MFFKNTRIFLEITYKFFEQNPTNWAFHNHYNETSGKKGGGDRATGLGPGSLKRPNLVAAGAWATENHKFVEEMQGVIRSQLPPELQQL